MIVKMSAVTFLLFDAFGTLVELDDFYGRLQRGFAQQGKTIPLPAIRRAAHREMRYYMKHSLRAHQFGAWEDLRHECAQILADALREENLQWDFSPQTSYRVLDDAIVFRAFPETREVLEELQTRGIPMGVLSNWDYQLPQVLRSLGLDNFFEFIVSSAQAGYEKPDARFFEFGLNKIRTLHPTIAPCECFYIGDHWEKDVRPAHAAGFQPLWIVRHERDIASGETGDAHDVTQLSSLHEVLHVLDIATTSTIERTRISYTG